MNEQRLDEILHKKFGKSENAYWFHYDQAKAALQALHKDSLREELEKLHRYDGKDYDTAVDEAIDERINQLNRKVEITEVEPYHFYDPANNPHKKNRKGD